MFISVSWSDGTSSRGSGAYVGPNDILTAAHVVSRAGAKATDISIFPAYNGTASASFPSFTSGTWRTNYFTVDADGDSRLSYSEASFDFAVIGISERMGDQTGWFGTQSYAGSGAYTVAGFPGEQGTSLTADKGFVGQSDVFDISGLYIRPGSSGGPIFTSDNHIAGVVSTVGWGARFDTEYEQIKAWIAGNDDLITIVPQPLILVGTSDDDVLEGGSGHDSLDGKGGADRLTGFGGNDRYYVDNSGDVVVEAAGGGADTVYASVSYRLSVSAEVEVVRTSHAAGTAGLRLTGSNSANTIQGNAGANVVKGLGANDKLYGYAGNDVLYGGIGNDVLAGGTHQDLFVFDTMPNRLANRDVITDFRVADDTILLDNAIYTKIGANGALKAGAFYGNVTGKAHDRDDRLIYEKDTGKLFYDADGTGSTAAVHFATLGRSLAMTSKDFSII